jgi:hypothetical protein
MSVEVLLLGVLVGLTILAYMIAINAHGPTRLSFSYLLATLLLAGTVWAVIQHVNSGLDRREMSELRRLELERQQAEQRARSREEELRENRERLNYATKLNSVINRGMGLATTMMNVDLRDFSLNLDRLLARARATDAQTEELADEFRKFSRKKSLFQESTSHLQDGLGHLKEAGNYYELYFKSEDSEQEILRERLMRQKARAAYEDFKKAGSLVASNAED